MVQAIQEWFCSSEVSVIEPVWFFISASERTKRFPYFWTRNVHRCGHKCLTLRVIVMMGSP